MLCQGKGAFACPVLLALGAIHLAAQTGERRPRISCGELRGETGYEFSVVASELVPADATTPEYCHVRGQVLPEILFDVALPTAWNGRFLMTGNGGFAGESLDDPAYVTRRLSFARRGFAWAATNTGHDGRAEPKATFARDRQKLLDYGFRSLHVTAESAKRLMAAYYGAKPARSYFSACSTGGRQALILAQRFPADFDGIIANAPILNFTATMIQFACDGQALAKGPIPETKHKLLAGRIYERCDSADGIRDGVIADPRRCDFQPARDLPKCGEGADRSDCFTAPQIHALETIYSDVTSHGRKLAPRRVVGAEIDDNPVSGYNAWFLNAAAKSKGVDMAESFFQYMAPAKPNPDWTIAQFQLDKDPARLAWMHSVLDATDPDLSAFARRGGKLLLAHGWADQALNPMMTVEYYESVRQRMGSSVADFFRLYLIPGEFHCGGGPGAASYDSLALIMEWVEQGKAPGRIDASHVEGGKKVRTRPLCPYPQVAKYKGSGSTDEAASFVCAPPEGF